jgi:hypothetical protein
MLLTALGVELMANVYLTPVTAAISRRASADALDNTFIAGVTGQSVGCRYVDTLYPHPYLGFVHHGNPPCGLPAINNIGLFGPGLPSERRTDRFVVLVTGGSVSAQLMSSGPSGTPYLQAILERDYVSPTGQPFLLLNGGDGGWHQPQQAILFLLYADAVNAVVTLDGFNERYFVGSSVRFEYPPNNFNDINPASELVFGCCHTLDCRQDLRPCARGSRVLSRSQAAYLALARLDAQ